MAVVVLGAIFAAAVVIVPSLSYVNLLYLERQQLRNLALGTMKTMLLDAGYPADWGSYSSFTNSTLQRFGLALDDSSAFYVLDPDKVSRLLVDNPAGHLGYDTIRDRLKLQGYGFNFKIVSPFNVTINDGEPVDKTTMLNGVKVLVTYNNDGSPIPNALVKAKIMYTKSSDNTKFYWATPVSNTTDALGRCTIRSTDPDFQSADVQDFVLILSVTVADLATISATYMSGFHQQVAAASIVGDAVTLWIPRDAVPNENPNGIRRIMSIVSVTETNSSTLYTAEPPYNDDDMTWGQGYSYWSRQFPELNYDETMFLVFTIRVSLGQQGGLSLVLFLGPRPNWLGGRIEAFGDPAGARSASSAVKIQRNVLIAGMTYIAELTMWKESL